MTTDVLVAGGGPAGMILALMLSARGIRTLVLEQNPNFDREYRGEVLMPRFTQMMRQIGLSDFLGTYPHLRLDGLEFFLSGKRLTTLSARDLCPEAPFMLWMPQTVMLGALYDKARTFPAFRLKFNAHAHELLTESGTVCGVRATVGGETTDIKARVVVAADGRTSSLRAHGGFDFEYQNHVIDILWFTVPKPAGYDNTLRAFVTSRHNCLALPKLPDHLQCGILLRAGEYAEYKRKGIDFLKKDLHETHPLFREFAETLRDFSPFSLLAAKAERVRDWARPGMLLVGDAAHTCSPAGAIGVSVAAGTAIVAADVITSCFENNDFSKEAIGRVQRLRVEEVRDIQSIQAGATRLIGRFSPVSRMITVVGAAIAAKTGIFKNAQRRLMVMSRPLPIREDWRSFLKPSGVH